MSGAGIDRQWLLLRGLAREQGHWGAFKELLQSADPASQVTGIDLPGSGVYHRLSTPYKMRGIAEFIHSHLQDPRPKQRIIVAISLGGMLATEIARLYPQCLDGLVIINSSFKNLSPVHHRLQMRALWHIFKAATASDLESQELAVLNMVSNKSEKEMISREWASIARERPVSPKNFLKQLLAAALYNLPVDKPQIPTLILNSEGDRMVNPDCSRKLAESWEAMLKTHANAGHELCLDDPEWVVEQVMSFFKSELV